MSELVFTTRGQAEALAAQEALRKKALDTKQEFEDAAKATGAWDASMMKLKSSAETALRSIGNEQEKIAEKIAKIQQAQDKGLIPPKEAEDGIKRLRQQWIEVDEETTQAREATLKQEQAYLKLRSTAESALRSVLTEEERIEEQIADIESAMQKGLIPPAEAQEGIQRLNDRLEDVRNESDEVGKSGSNLGNVFKKAFDVTDLAKFALGFVGIKSIIAEVKEEFADLQTAVDKRTIANLMPKERADELAKAAKDAEDERKKAELRVQEAERKLARAQSADDDSLAQATQQRRDEIAGLEQELARAHEDKRTAEAEHAKRIQEARERVAKELKGRKGDWGEEVNPESVREARKNLRELEAQMTPAGLQRRIADLEEQLARKALDEIKGGNSTGGARSALGEAQNDLSMAQRREIEARNENEAFRRTPAYQRATSVEARQKIGENLYNNLAEMGDSTQLSTDELEKLADAFRELGRGALARKIHEFAARVDDGKVSIDEMQEQLEMMAGEVRGYVGRQVVSAGGAGVVVGGRPRSNSEISEGERRIIQLLEEANRAYDRFEVGLREGGPVWAPE